MRLFCLAVLLALFAGPMVGAKTVNLDGEQASVDLPDTWTAKTQPGDSNSTTTSVILSALNYEKSSMLQILVCSNPRGMLAAQPDLVTNIKDNISNQIVSHGGQVQFTSEGKVSLNGVPAYLIQYTVTQQSAAAPPMIGRNYQIAANGKLYLISLRSMNAAAAADLQAIANSFRFESPPVLPTPQTPVHRIRYYLMAGAIVVVLAAFGVGIYYHRQRQLYE